MRSDGHPRPAPHDVAASDDCTSGRTSGSGSVNALRSRAADGVELWPRLRAAHAEALKTVILLEVDDHLLGLFAVVTVDDQRVAPQHGVLVLGGEVQPGLDPPDVTLS